MRRAGRTMPPDRGKSRKNRREKEGKNGGESSFPREGKRKQRQTGAEPARCVRRGKPASPHAERGGAVPTSRNNGRRQKAPHLFQGPRPHEGNTACSARSTASLRVPFTPKNATLHGPAGEAPSRPGRIPRPEKPFPGTSYASAPAQGKKRAGHRAGHHPPAPGCLPQLPSPVKKPLQRHPCKAEHALPPRVRRKQARHDSMVWDAPSLHEKRSLCPANTCVR